MNTLPDPGPCAGPVAPGLVVTLGDMAPVQEDLARGLPLLEAIRPDAVMLHSNPGPEDAPTVAALRRALPGVRIWIQAPANPLVRLTIPKAEARVRGWVKASLELGAEVFSLNGEGPSAPGLKGWSKGHPHSAEVIAGYARAVLAAAADEASGRLALAWSSHDCPQWHHLPWKELLGAGSPVALALPQVYCDPGRGNARATILGARGRYATAHGQQTRSAIRDDLRLGGEGCVLYAQSHHHRVSAACWLHDQAALSASWTVRHDGRLCDAEGLLALRAVAELRRQAGHAPGRIARFQEAAGLTVDGLVGPKTLAALGLA